MELRVSQSVQFSHLTTQQHYHMAVDSLVLVGPIRKVVHEKCLFSVTEDKINHHEDFRLYIKSSSGPVSCEYERTLITGMKTSRLFFLKCKKRLKSKRFNHTVPLEKHHLLMFIPSSSSSSSSLELS